MQSLEAILVLMLLWWLHPSLNWCYGFVLLSSSATGGNAKIFEPGTGNSYQLTSTIILNEPAEGKGKDVGYQIRGDVIVAVVWQNPNERNEKLLEIEVSFRNTFPPS